MAESSCEENVYDVERIIKDRMYRGKKQYLIKWVGYSEDDNTWEYEENLYCPELLEEYENNKKQKTGKKAPAKPKKTQKATSSIVNLEGQQKTSSGSSPVIINNTEDERQLINENDIMKLVKPIKQPDFVQPINNEWDPYIDSVIGAYTGADNVIQIELKTVDGRIATTTSQTLRYKAPLKLLDFYKANVIFPD